MEGTERGVEGCLSQERNGRNVTNEQTPRHKEEPTVHDDRRREKCIPEAKEGAHL